MSHGHGCCDICFGKAKQIRLGFFGIYIFKLWYRLGEISFRKTRGDIKGIIAFVNCIPGATTLSFLYPICDTIKGNESDVADIVFGILAKNEVKLFCFILFSALINCS